jgi:hypothetical protein
MHVNLSAAFHSYGCVVGAKSIIFHVLLFCHFIEDYMSTFIIFAFVIINDRASIFYPLQYFVIHCFYLAK